MPRHVIEEQTHHHHAGHERRKEAHSDLGCIIGGQQIPILKKIIGETVEAEIISGNLQKQSPIQTTVVAENLIPEDAKLLLKSFAKENCCEGNTKQLDFLNLAHNVKIFLGREWGDSNISHHSNVNKIEEIAFVLYCAAFVNKLMRLETDRIA